MRPRPCPWPRRKPHLHEFELDNTVMHALPSGAPGHVFGYFWHIFGLMVNLNLFRHLLLLKHIFEKFLMPFRIFFIIVHLLFEFLEKKIRDKKFKRYKLEAIKTTYFSLQVYNFLFYFSLTLDYSLSWTCVANFLLF